MSARKKAVAVEPVDLDPVELDPPDPAIARWQELADRDHIIEHGGDAEKVIPIPRPAWADPYCDIVGKFLPHCYYTSEWAAVALRYTHGNDDGTYWEPASVRVRAKLCGDGTGIVGMSVRRTVNGKWHWSEGVGMTPAEATELAQVLLAAVDLINSGND